MDLQGRVTSIALYGVFVDIGVGRDGLVHISEMSDTRINSPSDLVQIGDIVTVRIKGLDLDARRISLTMRSPRDTSEERPRRSKRSEVNHDKLAELKVGELVEGTITGLSSFGAFVDISVGKDGLVHISELSEGRVDRPEDAVQVGEQYTFKLLEVDPEGSRISLSLRRAQRVQKMRELCPGQMLEGTVSGLAAFGAFVDIGVGRDGLVHISQLSEDRVARVEDVVNVGDTITVRVMEVDPQSKRISLTMRPEQPEEPEQMAELEAVPGDDEVAVAPAAEYTTPAPAVASPAPEENRRRDRSDRSDRESRSDREGQGRRRGGRSSRASSSQPSASPETYTVGEDPDEDFKGDATLDDLMNKFGKNRNNKERRRVQDEEADEDEEDRTFQRQRQRDAIRRTLRKQDTDE
jgi:transcriptional accessory protein Tex/SPT6